MPEHVTFVRLKALPGKASALVDHMNRWEREQKSKAPGWVRTYLVSANDKPDELMAAIVWDNTANYIANGNRPEQDAWFRELRSNLAADPEWFDGHLLKDWTA